ncbi:MAG TPA: response regulator [Geobacteraceae bacterium]|nr:response regulator [Geobacteraceae bacterium]
MQKPKVLLVDDTKLFLELEKNFLKLSPVQILTASSGEEALKVAATERPDLIFMDITMPGMGGIACCGAIKADPELHAIPVIMVSSHGEEEDLAACRKAGCDDYLTKPVDRKLFLEKARAFLKSIDRRETRVPCVAPVTFTLNGISLSGLTADISCGGIYVAAEREVKEKRALSLEIALPEASDGPISIQGVVAWENGVGRRKKTSLPPGFGVEFTEISESGSKDIRSFVERVLKQK